MLMVEEEPPESKELSLLTPGQLVGSCVGEGITEARKVSFRKRVLVSGVSLN